MYRYKPIFAINNYISINILICVYIHVYKYDIITFFLEEGDRDTTDSQQLWIYQHESEASSNNVQIVPTRSQTPSSSSSSSSKRQNKGEYDNDLQTSIEPSSTGVNYQYIIPSYNANKESVTNESTATVLSLPTPHSQQQQQQQQQQQNGQVNGHSLVLDVHAHSSITENGNIILNASLNQPEFVTLPSLTC